MNFKRTERTQNLQGSLIRSIFESAPRDAINLGLGMPDFDTVSEIKETAKIAIDKGATKYTPNKGIQKLRELIAERYRNVIFDVNPENIIVTSGATEGIFCTITSIIESGDEVLIPDPGFLVYKNDVIIAGGKPVSVPLKEETEFRMLPDVVNELITDKTKMIILNSPSNPTGGINEEKDVSGIAELVDDNKLIAVSDETYEKFIYNGNTHFSLGDLTENAVIINTFSKEFGMTGWRIGWLVCKEEIINEILKVHQNVAACAPSISQEAAVRAISLTPDGLNSTLKEYKERRDLILQELIRIGIECFKPKGAFYVFPNFSSFGSSIEMSKRFLERGKIITVPGSAFGRYGEGYIRLRYALPKESIREAVKRIGEVVLKC